jgi:hypothetical protein
VIQDLVTSIRRVKGTVVVHVCVCGYVDEKEKLTSLRSRFLGSNIPGDLHIDLCNTSISALTTDEAYIPLGDSTIPAEDEVVDVEDRSTLLLLANR